MPRTDPAPVPKLVRVLHATCHLAPGRLVASRFAHHDIGTTVDFIRSEAHGQEDATKCTPYPALVIVPQ